MSERQRRTIGSSVRAHPGSYAAMSTPAEHERDLSKVLWIPGSALDLELDNGRPTHPPNFNPLQLLGELDLTYDPDFSVMQGVVKAEGQSPSTAGNNKSYKNGVYQMCIPSRQYPICLVLPTPAFNA